MARMVQFVFVSLLLVCSCLGTYTPYHVYLTLTGEATEIQLTFTTTTTPPSAKIQYYPVTDPSHVSTVYATKAQTMPYVTPYDHHEFITSVTMSALSASTVYKYTIACDSSEPAQAEYEFKTLPPPTDPITIVMYGDLGYEGDMLMTADKGGLKAWAASYSMDFIVHYGDLAYNLASNNGDIGDSFMHNLEAQNVSTRIPYVTVAGNHEYMEDKNSENMYRNWFIGQKILGERSLSSDPVMWHSYDIGDFLHMVGINTEVYCEDVTLIAAQMAWLEKDLATVRARTIQPWIVVYGHRQMYDGDYNAWHAAMMRYGIPCTGSTCKFEPCTSGSGCMYSLEEIFTKYQIDVQYAGHMHAYSRMLPIAPGLKYETQNHSVYYNPQHPVYIVSGAAGLETIPKSHQHVPSVGAGNGGASVYYNSADKSFTAMTAYNLTHLLFRQIITTDEVVDEFWVIKDPSRPKWTAVAPFTLGTINVTGKCDQ